MDDEQSATASEIAEHTTGTGRLEAFCDGVFAFAITLLVIDLKVPTHAMIGADGGLLAALAGQWPAFLAYVISFATIGIMWVNHHAMFHYIVRADRAMLLLHIAFLLLIAFVPFTTAVLAEYLRSPEARSAALLYGGEFFAISIAYNLIWWHGIRDPHLRHPRLHAAGAAAISGRYRLGPVLYAAATGLAVVSIAASLAIHAFLAVVFAIPDRRRPHAAAGSPSRPPPAA